MERHAHTIAKGHTLANQTTDNATLARDTAASAVTLLDHWPTLLDAIDGMVRQAMERGWSEQMARQMVAGVIASAGRTT